MFYAANAREWKIGETISGNAIAASVVMNCSDARTHGFTMTYSAS